MDVYIYCTRWWVNLPSSGKVEFPLFIRHLPAPTSRSTARCSSAPRGACRTRLPSSTPRTVPRGRPAPNPAEYCSGCFSFPPLLICSSFWVALRRRLQNGGYPSEPSEFGWAKLSPLVLSCFETKSQSSFYVLCIIVLFLWSVQAVKKIIMTKSWQNFLSVGIPADQGVTPKTYFWN